MKNKPLFTIVLSALFMIACSQTINAQVSDENLVNKWNFSGIEEFGVVRPPSTAMANDYLELKKEGSYEMMKEGKKTSGSWVLNKNAGILLLTDGQSRKKISFTIKHLQPDELVLEYQSPDLVRTHYHYKPAK